MQPGTPWDSSCATPDVLASVLLLWQQTIRLPQEYGTYCVFLRDVDSRRSWLVRLTGSTESPRTSLPGKMNGGGNLDRDSVGTAAIPSNYFDHTAVRPRRRAGASPCRSCRPGARTWPSTVQYPPHRTSTASSGCCARDRMASAVWVSERNAAVPQCLAKEQPATLPDPSSAREYARREASGLSLGRREWLLDASLAPRTSMIGPQRWVCTSVPDRAVCQACQTLPCQVPSRARPCRESGCNW